MKSVIICDMEGLILKMNNGAEKVFGYKPDELIGKKRVSIFSPGEIVIQNVLNWLKIANTKGIYEAKTNFIKKDGTLFNAKCKITPNFANGKNNPQTGYCGITEVIDEEVDVPISLVTKIIKGVAITRAGFASASLFPVLVIASYFAGVGDGLFSVLNLILTIFGIITLQLFSNLYNDYFDVKHGTDGLNNEYFNAGMNSKILEGAQISGGSRAIELGLISLKGTKKLANIMLLFTLFSLPILIYNSYIITNSFSNTISAIVIAFIGVFLGYFYTAKPLRLSARKGLGELTIFLTFGPLLTLGTAFAISSTTIDLFSTEFINFILLGIPQGLLTTNILFINQFPDYTSDKLANKNNLVVLIGKKNSRWIYLLFLVSTFIFMYLFKPILSSNLINFNLVFYDSSLVFLFLFGIYIFYGLYKNYNKRELINSNIYTIHFQSIFSIIFILLLNSFFI